jgi:hypothetical protein
MRSRWWRAFAVLCACSTGLAGGACGDSSDPEPEPPTALFGASVTVLSDEIWVHGGLAAPVGTSPPVTSVIPPGWVPNQTVVHYDTSGSVEAVIALPELQHPIAFSTVLVSSGHRYLLGSICRGAGGCGRETEPVLMELTAPEARLIPLDLPSAAFTDDVGAELLRPLGSAPGLAWTLQGLGEQGAGYGGLADQHRLLAIDLETGVGTDVPLPDGIYGEQLVCMADERVFAAQAEVTQQGQVRSVRILGRDARITDSEWELLVELPITSEGVIYGQLLCLEGTQELLLSLQGPEAELVTLSMTNGRETAPRVKLPPGASYALGTSEGQAVLLTMEGSRPVLWRHERDSPWAAQPSVTLSQRSWPILLDGRLYESALLRERLFLEGAELREIPGWQPAPHPPLISRASQQRRSLAETDVGIDVGW